jgi:hypothetical protein
MQRYIMIHPINFVNYLSSENLQFFKCSIMKQYTTAKKYFPCNYIKKYKIFITLLHEYNHMSLLKLLQ